MEPGGARSWALEAGSLVAGIMRRVPAAIAAFIDTGETAPMDFRVATVRVEAACALQSCRAAPSERSLTGTSAVSRWHEPASAIGASCCSASVRAATAGADVSQSNTHVSLDTCSARSVATSIRTAEVRVRMAFFNTITPRGGVHRRLLRERIEVPQQRRKCREQREPREASRERDEKARPRAGR
jgi:hypothetical protein